ncbi:hypothetical protein BC835DRAFT_1509009 [Cytidiella melzeri]|nr:hypothetical protein BC835DRAFT_1509009 [Cytidiella melzeri]
MCYAVPVIMFIDDVSGNVSKQWNKHHVVYASNANLPREMIEKEFSVKFVSLSPHASPIELAKAVCDSINSAAQNGVEAWDCKYDEEVLLLPYGFLLGGDNPMQAEECSHKGLGCNFFCQTCKVGGTKAHKASEEGFLELFSEGPLRTPHETEAEIRRQLSMSVLPGAQSKVDSARQATGVWDSGFHSIIHTLIEMGKQLRKARPDNSQASEDAMRKQLETELDRLLQPHSVDDWINPLLGLAGVNIHMDTPTEILHTVLLGVVKYFWGQTVHVIKKAKSLALLEARMESLAVHGLNLPAFVPAYICHYRGGLNRKHFKSLAQVMPFLIHDLVPQDVLDGWNVIGELVVLLWHTSIEDQEVYLAFFIFLYGVALSHCCCRPIYLGPFKTFSILLQNVHQAFSSPSQNFTS